MKRPEAERRKHPRTASILPLKISKRDLDVITETRNISCSGVYCRVTQPIPLMSKIDLTLLLPICSSKKVLTKKIKCSGVVVRSEPVIVKEADTACQNVAIFFTDLTKRDKDTIAQYVIQSFRNQLPHNDPSAS
ncbi:MAG: PilZ domain-containing protein [Candidatus Omnitrophica bacterium]|nr:PilZ domain-containing protein [Candidatus Omnitrophota bacterium]